MREVNKFYIVQLYQVEKSMNLKLGRTVSSAMSPCATWSRACPCYLVAMPTLINFSTGPFSSRVSLTSLFFEALLGRKLSRKEAEKLP